MHLIKCLVVSKDKTYISKIENNLKEFPFINGYLVANSYFKDLNKIENFNPSLVLLDINSLTKTEENYFFNLSSTQVPIIAFSDDPMDAVHCYSSGFPMDFMLKSFNEDRLMKSFGKAISTLNTTHKHDGSIFLKVGRIYKKVLLNEIIFLEAFGIYTKVHTIKERLVVNENITKLEARLEEFDFLRVHKSFVINTSKIDSFNTSHFTFDKHSVPIGISYKSKLEPIMKYLSHSEEIIA